MMTFMLLWYVTVLCMFYCEQLNVFSTKLLLATPFFRHIWLKAGVKCPHCALTH